MSLKPGYSIPGELAGTVSAFMDSDEHLPTYWMEFYVERQVKRSLTSDVVEHRFRCPFCRMRGRKFDCGLLRSMQLHISKEHLKFYECPVSTSSSFGTKADKDLCGAFKTKIGITQPSTTGAKPRTLKTDNESDILFPNHSDFEDQVNSPSFDQQLHRPTTISPVSPRRIFNLEVENTILLQKLDECQKRLELLEKAKGSETIP